MQRLRLLAPVQRSRARLGSSAAVARARAVAAASAARTTFFSRLGGAGNGGGGGRARGAPISAALATAALALYIVEQEASSPSAAVHAAARASGLSAPSVRKLVRRYEATGGVVTEDVAQRGAGSPLHPLSTAATASRCKAAVAHYVSTALSSDTPSWVTRQGVQAMLSRTLGLHLSLPRVGRLLAHLGYAFRPLSPKRHGVVPAFRVLLRRIFVIQLARAAALERDGLAALVFADESYANVKQVLTRSYAPAADPSASWAKGGGLGRRLCFIHALSRGGLLAPLGVPSPPLGDVRGEYASAEMMFAAQKGGSVGDYHGNFNHSIFMGWVLCRLIPALRARFPRAFDPSSDFRVFLGTDNAPYHVGSTASYDHIDGHHYGFGAVAGRFDPLALPKSELVARLRAAGCARLDIPCAVAATDGQPAGTRIIPTTLNDAFAAAKGSNGRTARLLELQQAAMTWLLEHAPAVLRNDLEAVLAAHGRIGVIWHPPNDPNCMPIEMVWARAKAYASAAFTGQRSIPLLAQHIRSGLYTGRLAVPGVLHTRGGSFAGSDAVSGGCAAAAALIDHVLHAPRGGVQANIDHDPALAGSLRALVVADPATRAAALLHGDRNALRCAAKRRLVAEQHAAVEEVEDVAAEVDAEDFDEGDGVE
jgi:transposase